MGSNNSWRKRSQALSCGLVMLAACLAPWRGIVALSLSDDRYSHIMVAPLIAGALICRERAGIFRDAVYRPLRGVLPVLAGTILLSSLGRARSLTGSDYYLSSATLAAVAVIEAEFFMCFGAGAFRRAAFPLGFLLLLIPVPQPWMKPVILGLQNGSAAVSAVLFRLVHLPALRQDLRFSLPGFDIEIAAQCSGIRSSIALVMTSVLAGYFLLGAWWRRLLLVLLSVPLVVFKNAVRIVTISSLGVYVNQSFLFGRLHRYSGLPFSLIEIAILAPIIVRWRRQESHSSTEVHEPAV